MKALRYLLIVIALLSVRAQGLAQDWGRLPEVQMYSTSAMVGSGSTLPSAAATGAVVTGEQPGTYTPANAANTGKHRAKKGWGEGGSDRDEPYKDPIGDAALPLALMAAAYALLRAFRRRQARE